MRVNISQLEAAITAQQPQPGCPDPSQHRDVYGRPLPQPAPGLQAVDSVHLYHWRFDRGEEFGIFRHREDADAMAAKHAGEGLSEVLSMAILGRPEPASGGSHIGRSWSGHGIEDDCPCPKAPCGLVVRETAAETCDQHPMSARRTIRQSHRADECPAAQPQPAPGIPLRADAETAAMLRADLADAEALLARWPKCPAGCNCRIGIADDPDANECGCDGPCNGGPAPELAAFVSEILGELRDALGADPDGKQEPGEAPEAWAVRLVHYLKERIEELHGLIAGREPLSVKPADDVKPPPGLAADADRLRKALENVFAVLDRQTLTYAERISYARTLIRTALEDE
jgi:hypothetical protein